MSTKRQMRQGLAAARSAACCGIASALAAACMPGGALAQGNPFRVAERPFLNTAVSRIVFMGDSAAWERYHEKLDKLVFAGEGQIHVAHIGGSHVQADLWSMQLRHRLQTLSPGLRAARGFVFPYGMAKSNTPWWYKPDFTGKWTAVRQVTRADSSILGIAGISATTYDTLAAIKVAFRTDIHAAYPFNRVRVLHRMDSSYAVHAWDPDSSVRIGRRVDEAAAFTEFAYDRYRDTLWLRIQRTDSAQRQFTLRGIVLDSDDPGIVLHALGVNGASTASWLRCQRFSEELALLRPDLVILSIGINDAHDPGFSAERFEANYRELIGRVRRANPDAAILLTTNTDSYVKRRFVNKNAGAVREAMLRLSASDGVGVWDTWGVMGGEGSIRSWEKAGLAQPDRVHLKRGGYELLGDLLY
ncbi:MAG: GDSL-type esterase/lipase family protein, partial [Flavobacteriales bacterium]